RAEPRVRPGKRYRTGIVHRAVRRSPLWRRRVCRKPGRRSRQHLHDSTAAGLSRMSRILVVEDETHLAEGLRFNLEAEGYAVTVTGKGEEALERLLFKKEPYDAMVLDVMLPGKDGFAVARELREAHLYIPLLMLTARSRPEDVLKGFESGADDYLPKPFNLAILMARLESLLRRKNWMRDHVQSGGDSASAIAVAKDATAGGSGIESESLPTFEFDGKVVDFQRLELQVGGEVFQLTLME